MADDILTNVAKAATGESDSDEAGPLDRKISYYVREIELYERSTAQWRTRSKKIHAIYRDERDGSSELTRAGRRFNVLWANVQILQPMLYARNPKPDVQRRYKDADPIGRVTSDILERSVGYFVDQEIFGTVNRQCVLDFLLSGRGTMWVRYVPHIREEQFNVTDDSQEGEGTEATEIVEFEETCTDYVHRNDFGHNVARTWEEVWCVWRMVYMTRSELHDRFDECIGAAEVDQIPLDYVQKDEKDRVIDGGVSKACIYELWDKDRKVACWFSKGRTNKEALDVREDPLGLEGFFPCPRPIFTNIDNDTLVPVPDFVEYQDQADELNDITARIAQIQKGIKVIGVHNAAAQGIERLFNEGTENQTIPIDNWVQFSEKGGLQGAMDMLDIKPYSDALIALYAARKEVKQDLDEISGMSDIVRSNTNPNETLGAQRLKSMYSTQRLSDRQREVQRFVRDAIRIMANIICNHFSIETIKTISGVRLLTEAEKMIYAPPPPGLGHNGGPPLGPIPPGRPVAQAGPQPLPAPAMPPGATPLAPPQAPPPLPKGVTPEQMQQMLSDPSWEDIEKLIRNQPMRSFRIDIETDSTIKADEMQQRQDATEFITAIGGLVDKAITAPPIMAPFLGQTVSWAARFFSVGKELEGSLNTLIQKFEKQAAAPQPPKPDPAVMKIQAETQATQQRIQGDIQIAQAKAQTDMQIEQAKAQAQAQADTAKSQNQAAVDQHQNALEAARQQAEMQGQWALERDKMNMDQQTQIQKAHIMAAASIEVARINAGADSGDEAEAREASGE